MNSFQQQLDELEPKRKELVDSTTQTSPKKKKPKKEYIYKIEVERILSHSTEGNKMGVRFLTKWQGFNIQTKERSDYILEQCLGGRSKLKAYLLRVMRENPNRFQKMLTNEPTLASILKD